MVGGSFDFIHSNGRIVKVRTPPNCEIAESYHWVKFEILVPPSTAQCYDNKHWKTNSKMIFKNTNHFDLSYLTLVSSVIIVQKLLHCWCLCIERSAVSWIPDHANFQQCNYFVLLIFTDSGQRFRSHTLQI